MRSLAFYKRLRDMGMDEGMALRAAEAFEEEVKIAVDEVMAPQRAKAAERTKRWREARAVTSGDVTEHHETSRDVGDVPCARGPQVVIPSLPSLRSEEVGGGGGECASERVSDWPDVKPTLLAKTLIETVGSPWLDPSKSQGLVTTAGRLAAWRRDGASWDHDVVPIITALCAKQRGPVSTWKFFDQAIARSIADNRAALEIPEARAVRATGPPSFTDRIAAENAEARRLALAMMDAEDGRKNGNH